VRIDPLQVHLNSSALVAKFHGVHEQVPDNLFKPRCVAHDRSGAGIENGVEPDALARGRWPHGVQGVLNNGPEVDRLNVQAHLAHRNTRDIKKIINQLQLGVGVSDDRIHRARQLVGADLSGLTRL
jgi:hypothetical protein